MRDRKALLFGMAKKQGADLSKLGGTVQNDILKEYIARGTYIYPPRPSMRLITDLFRYCGESLPAWNTISISGYHMREAGCTAVQELAFTFSDAIAYVQAAVDAGMDVDKFGARLSFFFVSQNNLLEEVAKFRAARKIWARIMKERFNAQNPRSWMVRFHTQTAGAALTAQQPENNIVRVTIQALAAVLGGTQSLHTNSMDEALALPSEKAATIALRTQQIVANESGCADVIDPLAGSFYLERLTKDLEDETFKYIERIDDFGGALGAIERGFIQTGDSGQCIPPSAGDRVEQAGGGWCKRLRKPPTSPPGNAQDRSRAGPHPGRESPEDQAVSKLGPPWTAH